MLVQDIEQAEKQYYAEHNDMVIPELLCFYYEEKKYELVYYLADVHYSEFGQSRFYKMMASMELGYMEAARDIFLQHEGDWYQFCKQYQIYWKHVALFTLYFKNKEVTEYYLEVFDRYYDDELIQLLELVNEAEESRLQELGLFLRVAQKYPLLQKVWSGQVKERKKRLLTFESLCWSIWNKYNASVQKSGKYGMEQVYQDEELSIYSYKPKQVAASMHVITDGISTVILDCGCEMAERGVLRISVKEILEELEIADITGVFISHAHMDHYGSLNELKGRPVYMTADTRQLLRYMSPDMTLTNVRLMNAYEETVLDGIAVKFIPNGHIRGSVMMDIHWKGGKRIVYTGDYTVRDQKTVKGFRVEDILETPGRKVDILITETTYGSKKDMLSLEEYEKIFITLCEKQFQYGNKIIIPCFAIGRAQEVAMLLSAMAREKGIKILIDGLASKLTEYYQVVSGENILNRNISVCTDTEDYREKIRNNDIILASSGMMKEGSTSAGYIAELIERENVCVMKVGYVNPYEHMLMSILNRKHKNLYYVDVPLSAHADYRSLVDITEKISAECVIYVHGSGIFKA